MKKYSLKLSLLFLLIVLFSCSTSLKTATESRSAEARMLKPIEGKALVYFFQSSSYLLKPGEISSIKIDEDYIGSITGESFIYKYLVPGKHTFEIVGQNKTTIEEKFEAGKTYYFENISATGFPKENTQLKLVGNDKGRKRLLSCQLSLE